MQPEGYVKMRDRSKDIIISGGENISSIEVEEALYRHHSVLSAGGPSLVPVVLVGGAPRQAAGGDCRAATPGRHGNTSERRAIKSAP